MFNWFGKKNTEKPLTGLAKIKADFSHMLETAQHEFMLACSVSLAGADADSVKEDLLGADKMVNRFERQIRKELVVHASVRGQIEPEILVMMSVAKDAERLGDYSKNIFDMGTISPYPPEGDDKERLLILRTLVERIFTECRQVFENKNEELATKIIRETTWIAKHCDHNTTRLLQLDKPTPRTASDVLMYRYMKRMVSHLRNICSSIVQPVHKIDFTKKWTRDIAPEGDLLDRKNTDETT
ncbi:MAG: PhoU domain-containing protein [Planctomycetia bacterium]|nr:PhoU domain-containing protein [Planctomycetia bacterium]